MDSGGYHIASGACHLASGGRHLASGHRHLGSGTGGSHMVGSGGRVPL